MDKDESEGIIVNNCSIEEDKSECGINKQKIMLHMMCQTFLPPLTYSNAEETFWTDLTCHMKERAWPLQEKNNLQRCWILRLEIIRVTAHHFPVKKLQ